MLLWLVTSTQVQSFSMNCFICAAAVVTSSKAVQRNGFYVTMLVAMTPPILRVVLRFIVSRSAFKSVVHCLGSLQCFISCST